MRRVESLEKTVRELAERFAVQVLAASPSSGTDLVRTDLRGPSCVVFGHEGSGVRASVVAACRGRLSISMAPGFDSLNVASAATVVLYEAARQRWT